MLLRLPWARPLAAFFVLTAFLSDARAGADHEQSLRVLFFSKSANYEHSVVKRVDGKPSHAENVLAALGAKHAIDFTFSKDGSLITPEYLARFDVLFFYTCGFFNRDVPNVDGQPPISDAGLQAVFDAVAGGKGFVGCHSAADCLHTHEVPQVKFRFEPTRWVNHGAASHPWVKFLGGEFIRHAKQQEATLRRVSSDFPGLRATPETLRLHEEWYSLKEFAADLHVIYVQETAGMIGLEYQRPPYPLTWARREGKGRVFYTALGHREDVWSSEFFQQVILAGLNWTGKRTDAALAPNLDQVAPGARQMPPLPPEAK